MAVIKQGKENTDSTFIIMDSKRSTASNNKSVAIVSAPGVDADARVLNIFRSKSKGFEWFKVLFLHSVLLVRTADDLSCQCLCG